MAEAAASLAIVLVHILATMATLEDTDISYRFRWRIPEGVADAARPIAEEIARRGRRNEDLGDTAARSRRLWVALNYVLGVPAAVLAGISGLVGSLDAEQSTAAVILAFASAGLGGVLAFLNPTVGAADANARANTYWEISHQARFMLATGIPRADAERATELLKELQEAEVRAMKTSARAG